MNSVNIKEIRTKVYEQIQKRDNIMKNEKNKQQDFIITYDKYEFKYKENDFIIFLIGEKFCIGKIIYIYKKNNSILTAALVKTIELQSKVLLNEGYGYYVGVANMVNVKETEMFINKYEEIDSNSTVLPLALFCKISTDVKQKLENVFNINIDYDYDYIKNLNIRSDESYKNKINISTYFQDISPFNMIDKYEIQDYFKKYTEFDEDFKELLGEIKISEDDNNKIKELLLYNSNLPQVPLSPVLASPSLPPPPPTGSNPVDEYANFVEVILEIFEHEYDINVESMNEKLDELKKLPIELKPKK
jgi:hypothetical protein